MSFIHGVLARNDYLNNIINLGIIVLLLPMRMKLMKIKFVLFILVCLLLFLHQHQCCDELLRD